MDDNGVFAIFLTLIGLCVITFVAGFSVGSGSVNEYWHRSCADYTANQIEHLEVPAKCVQKQ